MPDEVDPIIVVGQRRRTPIEPFPERPVIVDWTGQFDERDPFDEVGPDPCSDPETAREWNADAAAAAAVREFIRQARDRGETLNTREWGATILQRPDGSVTFGPVRSGQFTFQNPGPGGLATVELDWTVPDGWLLIGSVHTHFAGGHLPSGHSISDLWGD